MLWYSMIILCLGLWLVIYLICCLAGPSTLKLSQICSFLLMFHLVMDGSVIGKGQRNIPPRGTSHQTWSWLQLLQCPAWQNRGCCFRMIQAVKVKHPLHGIMATRNKSRCCVDPCSVWKTWLRLFCRFPEYRMFHVYIVYIVNMFDVDWKWWHTH